MASLVLFVNERAKNLRNMKFKTVKLGFISSCFDCRNTQKAVYRHECRVEKTDTVDLIIPRIDSPVDHGDIGKNSFSKLFPDHSLSLSGADEETSVRSTDEIQLDFDGVPGHTEWEPEPTLADLMKPEATVINESGTAVAHRTVQYKYHQANFPDFEKSELAGTQCTSMSFQALSESVKTAPHKWKSSDVKRILKKGHALHERTIADLNIKQNHFLSPEQYPPDTVFSSHHQLMVRHESYGCTAADIANDDSGSKSLLSALKAAVVPETIGAILTVDSCDDGKGFSCAVIPDKKSGLWIYDSHSRSVEGLEDADGGAVLLFFHDHVDLVSYIKQLHGEKLFNIFAISKQEKKKKEHKKWWRHNKTIVKMF